jgi:hypothetical protein
VVALASLTRCTSAVSKRYLISRWGEPPYNTTNTTNTILFVVARPLTWINSQCSQPLQATTTIWPLSSSNALAGKHPAFSKNAERRRVRDYPSVEVMTDSSNDAHDDERHAIIEKSMSVQEVETSREDDAQDNQSQLATNESASAMEMEAKQDRLEIVNDLPLTTNQVLQPKDKENGELGVGGEENYSHEIYRADIETWRLFVIAGA